jgi:hypothetical protein
MLLLVLVLTTCDDFNRPLKEDIEYYLSIIRVDSWTRLEDEINALPANGKAVYILMQSFSAEGPMDIKDGKDITIEPFRDARTETVITRAFITGYLFEVIGGASLTLGGRGSGTLIFDGGADWNNDNPPVNNGIQATRSLIHVDDGSLKLRGGAELRNNHNTAGYGGGVLVENGSFDMEGGLISGNTANLGGGVHVINGTFTMTGGGIKDNQASDTGGGVLVEETFIMSGNATIHHNTADNRGGGVVVNETFTMSGNAAIHHNTANDIGGGVVVDGDFTMSGNTVIHHNTGSGMGGGGAYVDGTFTMTGGGIEGNTTSGMGGGVYADGSFKKDVPPSGGSSVIYGKNEGEKSNTAASDVDGHAVYISGYPYLRNSTAGPGFSLDSDTMSDWE